MIRLYTENDRLIVRAEQGDLAPRHESQLAFWGFQFDVTSGCFVAPPGEVGPLVQKVTAFLERGGRVYELEATSRSLLVEREAAQVALAAALAGGSQFKNGRLDRAGTKEFVAFLDRALPRKLKEHQLKTALHLLSVRNGACFSVPGSGKTAVVLAVFQRLRALGEIDALFVVGPAACFGPWRAEYTETLGRPPSYEILAGGDVEIRRTKYLVNQHSACDLYLTTFQTLQRDWERVRVLFRKQGVRFYFVVDEAHYIKQLDGVWANAVLNVARHAARRTILTGTPFPRSYSDAFNLFDVLWPHCSPIPVVKRHKIEMDVRKNRLQEAAETLNGAIGPLFYRVRKTDLGLTAQEIHPPVSVRMNLHERRVYDSILDKIKEVSKSDYLRDIDLLSRLRRGRLMRLRQCLSYSALLSSTVSEYKEDLLEGELSLADIITHYDELETPGKLEALLPLARGILSRGDKVVIWSNFVRTLELIHNKVRGVGHQVRLIYGATPIHGLHLTDELTREEIIREFVTPDNGVDVLVANPAACAESISLHKACSHAIYYDLSYNCAQYLQSLDRIHRVGGSENKVAHYHFLQYEDSLDADILANVQAKAEKMSQIIDQDYAIYSLDMFAEDEELEAYDRLFGRSR